MDSKEQMAAKKREVDEVSLFLELMINRLENKIDNGFERIDNKLGRYATKSSLRYVVIAIIFLFFLILDLHGFGGIIPTLKSILQ